jgi:integrase
MPKLTDRLLSTLRVEGGRKDRLLFDTVAPGLGVRVTARGTRMFIAQWTDPATRRKVRESVGVWGNLTVDQAREAVRVLMGQVAKGVSPRAERLRRKVAAENERAETALSLDALVDEWAKLHLALRRERYRHEAQRAIRSVFATLLKRPAARVTRAEVVNILDALVKAGRTAMAARALAYARAAFQWAMKRGKIATNPFVGLPIATTTADRDRVLSDSELAEIWSAATKMGYPWGAFFAIAILTLQRREEVASMRWSEISQDFATWSIPASRMKSGKAHDVHLSEAALAVLRGVRKQKPVKPRFATRPSERIAISFSARRVRRRYRDFRKPRPRSTRRSSRRARRARLNGEAKPRRLPHGACMICVGPAPRPWRGSASTAWWPTSCSPISRQNFAASPESISGTILRGNGGGLSTPGPRMSSPTATSRATCSP